MTPEQPISPPRGARPSRRPLHGARLLLAVTVGFGATLACVAAATEPTNPEVHPLTADPNAEPTTSVLAPSATALSDPDSGAPRPDGGCPYGALEDPHRGFIRCLSQGEKSPFDAPDAGPVPPSDAAPPSAPPDASAPVAPTAAPSNTSSPNTPPPDAAAPDAAPPAAPTPGPVPLVEMKAPKFENGDVPKAEKNLSGKKVLDAIAKCVSDAGGLTAKTGSLKVELLVRARGKAEGVEVKPTGVPEEAAKCVRAFLKNRAMGTPTADPTGVTVVYTLKPASK